jgi:hypothetical protein
MKADTESTIIRCSVALPRKLVNQAKAVAPEEVKENFNRLVFLALEDFALRRRKKAFEEAMDQMGADPEIRREIII